MKIYFNSTFIETKRETDDLFVKGNNGNKLEAYFEDLDLSNVNISLRLVIGWSNGELTNELPMNKSFDNQYAYINLPKLKHDGNTQFIIKIYQNGTLLQTAIFTRNIKATLEANDNTNINTDEYQGLLNQIKDIDDKANSNSTRINELQETINDVSNASQDNSESIELNKTRINQLQQSINGTDSDVANLEDRLDKLEDGLADGKIELTNYVTKEEFNVVANASQDNAEKLKQVYTIEEVDIEVNDLRQEVGNYYVKKTDQRIKSVDYNIQSGIFTFTKQDGTIFEVDLAIEKVVTNFVYNKTTQKLELTLADGTVQSIPMSDFASAYEGVENDQIQVSIQSGNKIQAILKDGSININHLNPKFANDVNTVFTAVGELQNHVQDNTEAIANRYTKQETSDLIDAEVGDAKEELKNVYLKKSKDPVTDDGQIVIVNADGSTGYTTETFYEIANRISNLEQNQGSGGSAVSASIFETIVIDEFSALEEAQGPYTHFAEVTLTNSLDDKASVELLNNNAVLFATYGFAIASVSSGNVVTVYSINKPAESVTLTFEIVKAYKVWDGSYTEGAGASLINFTVNGTEYQAEEGMTWEQWVNSSYNINSYGSKIYDISVANFIKMYASGYGEIIYISTDGTSYGRVLKTDLIQTLNYQHYIEQPGGGN